MKLLSKLCASLMGLVALSTMLAAAMFFFIPSAHAAGPDAILGSNRPSADVAQPDVPLQPMGGGGGGPFVARCPQGEFLTGMELRAGLWIDAIRPLCVTASGSRKTTPAHAEGDWHGGTGGGPNNIVCPNDLPVVIGMEVVHGGKETTTVINMWLYCGLAVATPQQMTRDPSAEFVPPYAPGSTGYTTGFTPETQRCRAGLVAVGINGRSGVWLDALGLICGAVPVILPPLVVAVPVKPVPRDDTASIRGDNTDVRATPRHDVPVVPAPPIGPPAINLAALQARGAELANNDSEAGELRDQQRQGPARRGFEIGLAASEGQTLQSPGNQQIHDMLTPAEQDGFTTAVTFSLSRNKQKITDLAAKGKAIANEDPLAAELRDEQADEAARRGFDIGMAAAEGQTLPSPGNQKIHDSLSAVEQGGFTAAVTFSLDRNKNADLAAKGAAIAEQDRFVARARNAEPDAMHRLGFDIATGIFGDPVLGALGTTDKDEPGALKIRAGLSFLVQRGFNSSKSFHLSRDYGPL